MEISVAQALGWRLQRHLLSPVGTEPVEGVVDRVGACGAQSASAAELMVRVRQQNSEPGDVARALDDGRIIKSFTFRGATQLMTPQGAAAFLTLRAAGRMWELPSWRSFYGLEPADWDPLRASVREALGDDSMTRAELADAMTSQPQYAGLDYGFRESNAFLKPFAWRGDLCFGPPRDGEATYQRLDRNPHWTGPLPLDEAGRYAVEHYVHNYGPATAEHLHYWLGGGLSAGRKRINGWLAEFADRFARVDVDGEPMFVLREDLDVLASTDPSDVVRLLPGHDPWVIGPGTADPRVVPQASRTPVTRGANLVVVGGVVAGTWTVSKAGSAGSPGLAFSWFSDSGPVPQDTAQDEVDRVTPLLGT